jgi:hypothetical protein
MEFKHETLSRASNLFMNAKYFIRISRRKFIFIERCLFIDIFLLNILFEREAQQIEFCLFQMDLNQNLNRGWIISNV